MAGKLLFNRNFAEFGAHTRPFEKADDIGNTVAEFLWYEGSPFYPIGAIIDAKMSSVWLGEGEPFKGDEDNLDLIFKMRESDGGSFFEIVLRSSETTTYGGWAWGQELEVTDEIIAGHRVLIVHEENLQTRLEYSLSEGTYVFSETNTLEASSTILIRKMNKQARARRYQ